VQKDTQALGHPRTGAVHEFRRSILPRALHGCRITAKGPAGAGTAHSGTAGARRCRRTAALWTELAAAKTANDKLLEQLRRMDEASRNAELKKKDRENKSFVPRRTSRRPDINQHRIGSSDGRRRIGLRRREEHGLERTWESAYSRARGESHRGRHRTDLRDTHCVG